MIRSVRDVTMPTALEPFTLYTEEEDRNRTGQLYPDGSLLESLTILQIVQRYRQALQ